MNLKEKIKTKFSDLRRIFRSFFGHEFFKNSIVLWLLVLSLVVNLTQWIILKIFIKPVDFPVILHYNVYFGVDMVGDYRFTFVIPSIGLVLLAINLLLSRYFYLQKERIASHLLMITALMIQMSLFVATLSVIIINY